MRRFEFSDSTSNKFWEVDVKGKTLNVTFGKIGTKGQSKPKDFTTPEKAKAEMEKLIKEKMGKGYVEVGSKAAKAIKPAAKLPAKLPAKSAAEKKTNAGNMGEGLSKVGKKAKAEKVLAMFAGGQWELARGILEAAQEEHWLFKELLEGCKIEDAKPMPSTFMQKFYKKKEKNKAELVMLEVLLPLPKDLKKLQKLREKLGIQIREGMLSKYWKEIGKGEFDGVKYGDPVNFNDDWHKEREAEIAKVEKECEARSKGLNKAWLKEEDLGNGVSLEMILIPAGNFKMGSPLSEKGRNYKEKQHEVMITKPNYLGKYPVTQAQWQAIMVKNPSGLKGEKLSVTGVSWTDCQEFIKKLNSKTDGGYRLPSEAEWEYACRAGTKTAYSFGHEITTLDANYNDSMMGKPLAVGSYKPNAFGLYDMHGNVWEWCEDGEGNYPSGAVTDPKGPLTESGYSYRRVLRGGSFNDFESDVRSSARINVTDYNQYNCNGFRLARTAL